MGTSGFPLNAIVGVVESSVNILRKGDASERRSGGKIRPAVIPYVHKLSYNFKCAI